MTPAQKAARIVRARAHVAADRLISGVYAHDDGVHGCSVGCDAIDIGGTGIENIPSLSYFAIVAEHDGTAEWLERLRDTIYEGLPADQRARWHVAMAEALPCVEDWEPVRHRVCIAILEYVLTLEPHWYEPVREQVADAVRQCIAYHQQPAESAASAAKSAAESAASAAKSAASAAWSAAGSAESTAWSAAGSAASAAWSAASAAGSAAGNAAGSDIATLILTALRTCR